MVPTRKPMFVSAIHVDDLCTALFRVFQSGERRVLGDAGASGIYYAAADEILQYADLGRLVAQALGRNGVRVLKIPAWASYLGACFAEGVSRLSGRTQILRRDKWREATAGDWTCDAARLREQLGWAPGRSLLERLTETVHGYREAGQL